MKYASTTGTPARVAAFVDGFNLYHSICDLRANHLKWLDIWAIVQRFARPPAAELEAVFYFSAYATWLRPQHRRHREYVAALGAVGVVPILGQFKKKTVTCKICRRSFQSHEEKETDVNIALHLVRGAVRDEYDTALILSGDSDLAPAVRMVKHDFPKKKVLILTPPGRSPSYDLLDAAGGPHNGRLIKPSHVAAALLPRITTDRTTGQTVATRPSEYDPPTI